MGPLSQLSRLELIKTLVQSNVGIPNHSIVDRRQHGFPLLESISAREVIPVDLPLAFLITPSVRILCLTSSSRFSRLG